MSRMRQSAASCRALRIGRDSSSGATRIPDGLIVLRTFQKIVTSALRQTAIAAGAVAAPWREDIEFAVARHLEGRSGGWRPAPI